MPRSGFLLTRVSLTTSRCLCVSFCTAVCVVSALNFQAIPSKACISTARYKCSPFFWKLCWNYFQIIFAENETKWKRSDGDSANAVREELLVLRYQSEPSRVESSVSTSSAYYQYCHSAFSVALGSKNDIDKKHRPWSVAKNWKYSDFSKNYSYF